VRASRAIAAALVAAGCSGLDPDGRALEIVGGAPDSGDPAVVAVVADDALCSGALISPRVVVTAAHCVEGGGAPALAVYFGSALAGSDPHFVERIDVARAEAVAPAWSYEGDDLALLLLERPARARPLPFHRTPLAADDIGAPLRLVGWGLDDGGRQTGGGVKREAPSELAGFYTDAVFTYGDAQVTVCLGDSGGPTFMDVGGVETIVGVTSWTTQGCAGGAGSTHVARYVAWIEAWIAEHDAATPPTVSIARPAPDAWVPERFHVEARAQDEVGVDRVELYLDGELRATARSAPYVFEARAAPGPVAVEVRAHDAGGAAQAASIAVTVGDGCDDPDGCDAPSTSGCAAVGARPGGRLALALAASLAAAAARRSRRVTATARTRRC
jgi:hypothetical protein